jgi:hypothetical protein
MKNDTKRAIQNANPLSSTQKKRSKINGKILYTREGWIGLEVFGTPYEMGFAHGRLLRGHFSQVVKVLKYVVDRNMKSTLSDYVKTCKMVLKSALNMPEWGFIKEEIKGICDGCANSEITFDFLVAWNAYLSMCYYSEYRKNRAVSAGRCSAFIATGSATAKGDIIMAHNTHSDLASGFICNVVLHMRPEGKLPFTMQTSPGLVCSSADWFITSAGIVGCETTITNVNYDADFSNGVPYFFRIRKAMETGQTLDDYVTIMEKQNAGDYPCSWLLGDINTGTIMRFELSKNTTSVSTTNDGVYYGMNSAISPEIRLLETDDYGLNDPMKSTGSRNMRLEYLLMKKYYGKINIEVAKKVIADHYDEGTNRYHMGMRGICKHVEAEDNPDFSLSGATDGKVVNSKMAQNLQFMGIFGSSCGRPFKRKDYVKKVEKSESESKLWKAALQDVPRYDWIKL